MINLKNINDNFKNFIPGFSMGITRALVSHPFELLKINSQIGNTNKIGFHLFKGVHYSVITNGLERGVQFFMFDHFKKRYGNDNKLISSVSASLFSTLFTFPYNVILLKKTIMNEKLSINKSTLYKTSSLEYVRNLTGSTIFLYTYDTLKSNNQNTTISSIGATSLVWTVTYPIDSVKNQILSGQINIKNVYRGIQYPLIRSIPSSIVGMFVYEKVKYLLN